MPTFPLPSLSVSRVLIAVLVAAIGAWAIENGAARVGAVQVDSDEAAVDLDAEESGATPVAEVSTEPGAESWMPPDDAGDAPAEIPLLGIEPGPCTPKDAAQASILRGDSALFTCEFFITVTAHHGISSGSALAWTVTLAESAPEWAAVIRPEAAAEWNNQEASGVIAEDSEHANVITTTIDLRVTAPTITECGDPLTPAVTLIPSVAPVVDGVPGQAIWGAASRPALPELASAAPTVSLSTSAAGDDAGVPASFSHFDQAIDAGVVRVTVTSAACDGWDVLLGGSGDAEQSMDFMDLTLRLDPGRSDLPALALREVRLDAAPQTIAMTGGMAVPPGTYTFVYRVTLTIPGGTPPGTYRTTLAVSVAASP